MSANIGGLPPPCNTLIPRSTVGHAHLRSAGGGGVVSSRDWSDAVPGRCIPVYESHSSELWVDPELKICCKKNR